MSNNDTKKPEEENYTGKTFADYLKDTSYATNSELAKQYQDQYDNNKFVFDLNGNAIYNQYKDYHTKQAKLGMEDAIGRAAALTGGYGNSYALSAGQQAYYNEMDKVKNIIPQLYEMAYGQYKDEQSSILDMANRHAGLAQTDYDNALKLYNLDNTPVDVSKVPAQLTEQLEAAKSDQEIDALLDEWYGMNAISRAQGAVLKQMYGKGKYYTTDKDGNQIPYYTGMMNYMKDWGAGVDDGGFNWFGGIDGNAQVKTPLGEFLTGDQLLAKLKSEDMTEQEARNLIAELQKLVGVWD